MSILPRTKAYLYLNLIEGAGGYCCSKSSPARLDYVSWFRSDLELLSHVDTAWI